METQLFVNIEYNIYIHVQVSFDIPYIFLNDPVVGTEPEPYLQR